MHILFYHQNFPAQFGHLAHWLVQKHGWKATFISRDGEGNIPGVTRIRYKTSGGATERTHYCARSFENWIWNTNAVFDILKSVPKVQPDLIVGHSGFGSTLFLRELYPKAPIINYFEYFYHTTQSDLDFRPEFPPAMIDKLRARARNAALLLDLENCDAGYSPTHWQNSRLPKAYQPKLRVIFDGIDTELWKPGPPTPRIVGSLEIPEDAKVVTYVSRGLESMRGFDVFMRFAKALYLRRPDVCFVVVGDDRVCYGGDEKYTGEKSFKSWVLKQDSYDMSRFAFIGKVPPAVLARLFQITDLHVYLTAPFVLSWSLLNALSCGALVLASSTPPVKEVIQDGVNGLLTDFFDYNQMAERANRTLNRLDELKPVRQAALNTVLEKYSSEVCLPQLKAFFESVASAGHTMGSS